jgi:hypothetical protein
VKKRRLGKTSWSPMPSKVKLGNRAVRPIFWQYGSTWDSQNRGKLQGEIWDWGFRKGENEDPPSRWT